MPSAGNSIRATVPGRPHSPSSPAEPLSRPPALKRRKVRRGTSSCWACRQRKVRCSFASGDASVCVPCRRRGSECVSQTFQLVTPGGGGGAPGRHRTPADVSRTLRRVEGLVSNLLRGRRHVTTVDEQDPLSDDPKCSHDAVDDTTSAPLRAILPRLSGRLLQSPSPPGSSDASVGADGTTPTTSPESVHVRGPSQEDEDGLENEQSVLVPPMNNFSHINSRLHSMMPAIRAAMSALRGATTTDLPLVMLQKPYGDSVESSQASQTDIGLLEIPNQAAHPVLLARRLLQIALGLQLIQGTRTGEKPQQYSRSYGTESRRFFHAATHHVTSKDNLVASYEGIETLMLEGLYHINDGNPRQAWLTFRRAIGIAQVMSLASHRESRDASDDLRRVTPRPQQHEPPTTTTTTSQFLWFRLNYSDRFLSLMLGLPLATADDNFASSAVMAAEVPLGRLERLHTVTMGRLIARNQRIAAGADHFTYALRREMTETESIDDELHRTASLFPARWWLSPEAELLSGLPPDNKTDSPAVAETSRLLGQVNHAHLLLVLHLPYAMQTFSSGPQPDCAYSAQTAIKACRDVLSRFSLYRKFHRIPSCCRTVDFKAFTAAASLLLAHLQGHGLGRRSNTLRHHGQEDRALVELATDDIEALARLSPARQGEAEAQVLRALLGLEERVRQGLLLHAVYVEGRGPRAECRLLREGETVEFEAPFLGHIRIETLECGPRGFQNDISLETCAILMGSEGGAEAWAWPPPLAADGSGLADSDETSSLSLGVYPGVELQPLEQRTGTCAEQLCVDDYICDGGSNIDWGDGHGHGRLE